MIVKISGKKKIYPSYFFQACSYRAHRAVTFAIAQLSCLVCVVSINNYKPALPPLGGAYRPRHKNCVS